MTKYPKKILVISGSYPKTSNSQQGSFVKESVDTMKKLRRVKIYLSVSRSLPFNDVLVFIKYLRIIVKSLFICIIHRPQFIIAHTVFPAGFLALMIAKLFNIKIVVFAHGGDIMGLSKTKAVLWEQNKMTLLWKIRYRSIQLVLQKADGIIYVSDYLFDTAKKYFKTEKNKSLVSPIGFNPNIFYQFKQFKEKKNIILYVGRIDEKKGIYKFFTILASISEYLKKNDFLTTIIGRVDDDDFYSTMNNYNEILNIEYLGEKSRNELAVFFNSSLITLVPSFYESFGLVAVESLACGTPVASYPVGGLRDIVIENYNGIFLDKENDVESGNKLMRLLQNKDVLEKYSQNSKTSIKKYNIFHTHKNNLKFIDKIYNNKI